MNKLIFNPDVNIDRLKHNYSKISNCTKIILEYKPLIDELITINIINYEKYKNKLIEKKNIKSSLEKIIALINILNRTKCIHNYNPVLDKFKKIYNEEL